MQVTGPPEVSFDSVVNGATFNSAKPVSPGAIVSLFGTQLAPSTTGAASTPLPTELESTKVIINGIEAPLFFVSYRQINFQIPWETPQGMRTVQVVRDGQAGNSVSADISDRSSGIFRLNIGEYGVIVNASQSTPGDVVFALPEDTITAPGLSSAPARPGDALVIFAAGLGAVLPAVGTGEEPPPRGTAFRSCCSALSQLREGRLRALRRSVFCRTDAGLRRTVSGERLCPRRSSDQPPHGHNVGLLRRAPQQYG